MRGPESGYHAPALLAVYIDLAGSSRRHLVFGNGKADRAPVRVPLILGVLLILSAPAFAGIDDKDAIRAIVGEAENQGLTGMTAIGEAIRNRGHLRGVYGKTSPRVKKASKRVWAQARRAWHASETSNLVKSADHWENVKAFGVPPWARGMQKTVIIGDHQFYKSKKGK